MRRRGSSGFTLLEVLIASLIMAIAITGLLSNLTTSLRNASRLTEYDRAVLLARHRLDELLLVPRLPPLQIVEGRFDLTQSGGVEAGWRARASIFEGPPNAGPGVEILERIEVQVWWTQGEKRKTFPIEGYRKRMMLPDDQPPQVMPPL